jgi:hypothetical protein
MRGIAPIASLALAFVLMSCGSGAASGPDSGIRGRAFLAPTCPVETNPPRPGCQPKPLSTRIAVLRYSDRHRMATVQSGKDGRFTVRIRPGRYYLTGASNKRPHAETVLVGVRAHKFTRAKITFDSGIR